MPYPLLVVNMNAYVLTDKGKRTALQVLGALSDGYTLEQTALVSGLDEPDAVRAVLRIIAAAADLVPPVSDDDPFL
jgi:hypothetical protein